MSSVSCRNYGPGDGGLGWWCTYTADTRANDNKREKTRGHHAAGMFELEKNENNLQPRQGLQVNFVRGGAS